VGVTHRQKEMKIAVIGSRGIDRIRWSDVHALPGDTIISGGAKGVDTLAANYARARGLDIVELRPDYGRYGKSAPHVRNGQIIDAADRIVAFWDGKSRGTKSVIERARKHGKQVDIVMC